MSATDESAAKRRRLEALAESPSDAMLMKSLDISLLRRLLLHVSHAEGVPAPILDHLANLFGPMGSTPFAALSGDVEQRQSRLNGDLRLREGFVPEAAPNALVETLALHKRVFVRTEAGARALVHPVLATAARKAERLLVFTDHCMQSAPIPTTRLHVHGPLDYLSARPFRGSEAGDPGSRPRVPFFCAVEAPSIVVGVAWHTEQLPLGYAFGALTDGTSYRFYAVHAERPSEFYRSLVLHVLENVMQGLLPPAFEITATPD
eukprot:m51a1_g13567 hypothetical protein (262) ;mRNA; r:822-1953